MLMLQSLFSCEARQATLNPDMGLAQGAEAIQSHAALSRAVEEAAAESELPVGLRKRLVAVRRLAGVLAASGSKAPQEPPTN